MRATAWLFFGNQYGQSWYRLNGPNFEEDHEYFPIANWLRSEIEGYDANMYRQSVIDTGIEN